MDNDKPTEQQLRAAVDMRASMVRRFHTVPAVNPPTVAEHSFRMLQLIMRYRDDGGGNGEPPRIELVRAVMNHDLPEFVTGDAPRIISSYEDDAARSSRWTTERKIITQHGWDDDGLLQHEVHELKAADLAEALHALHFLNLPEDYVAVIDNNLTREICAAADKSGSDAYRWMLRAVKIKAYNMGV